MAKMTGKYIAVVFRFKKCPDCDAQDIGIFTRVDCGCVTRVEIGRYRTRNIARLVAARAASLKGTRLGGRNTGNWNIETEDGVIEWS